jgi:hypothetical protein
MGFNYLLKYKLYGMILPPEEWCVEDVLGNAIIRLNENFNSLRALPIVIPSCYI